MGAGYHGGFGNTNGKDKTSRSPFKSSLFSYEDSKSKIVAYLLNLNHNEGKSKAKFFIETLGYSQNKPKQFFDNIAKAINKKIPVKETATKYGLVYEFHEKIESISGQYEYARIVVSVQKDYGKITYRLITAYPDKKG